MVISGILVTLRAVLPLISNHTEIESGHIFHRKYGPYMHTLTLRLCVLYFISQNPFLFAHNRRIILTACAYSTGNMFVFSHFYSFHLNHPRTLNIPPR